jgi:ribA/ribD-fused uncharacterized protein
METGQATFMFFSNSADAAPGCGAREAIPHTQREKYTELAKIKHWRRALSNFHAKPEGPLFELDNRRWRTVEHYFQGNKFIKSHPEYYEQFALDSDSALSKGSGADARHAGRAVKMTEDHIKWWDEVKREVMWSGRWAKFTQNDDLATTLKLTDGAILLHRMTFRSSIVAEDDLMLLRDKLLGR